ncbi:MAG: Trm112 family protein [Candidatus Omnitrophica bacterium]|nr:Trm112 family protein [Candidatus Omnitrophota bacterium]
MTLDPELIDILVCPDCKSGVKLQEGKIICLGCGRKYPVKNGIPIMLIDESEPPNKQRGENA